MKVFVYTMIAVCAVGNALHAGDFELLIIGDSITAGVDGTVSGETIPARASYRPDLYDELDAGVPSSYTGVKFVGPNDYHQGSDLLKHASFRGAPSNVFYGTGFSLDSSNLHDDAPRARVKDECYGWGTGFSPDAVIIQVGTNDVLDFQVRYGSPTWEPIEESTLFARINNLVDEVQLRYSTSDIFVCNLINIYSDEVTPGVYTTEHDAVDAAAYNYGANEINDGLASELSGQGVTIIDINSVYSPSTESVADGVHPSSSGEEDIAAEIWSAMKDYYNW